MILIIVIVLKTRTSDQDAAAGIVSEFKCDGEGTNRTSTTYHFANNEEFEPLPPVPPSLQTQSLISTGLPQTQPPPPPPHPATTATPATAPPAPNGAGSSFASALIRFPEAGNGFFKKITSKPVREWYV